MASLKTLFDLSSGITFLTSVKLNLILSRGILYISSCLGSVILVINLLTRSLLACVSAIFLPTCGLPHTDCFNIWSKRRSPPHPQHYSSLIYSFTCVCRLQYIGRTNQCLHSRIKQHVPTKIRQENYFADQINHTYESSIAEHLLNNRDCALSYSADLFTTLIKSHSDYYQKVLETIHILTHKPSLCKQRECLLGLTLIST